MTTQAAYWRRVVDDGLDVPSERPLVDLAAELTTMLGSPDPAVREDLAYPALSTWVRRGVFDDLLTGFGDGLLVGLRTGLGEHDTAAVFRRAQSARLLADCLRRDLIVDRLTAGTVVTWGDRLAAWLVRERDVRGWLPVHGWAHAVAYGGDALAALASSSRLGEHELTVVLDVVADRLLLPADRPLTPGATDRLALAALSVLRRGLVSMDVVEAWVARVARAGSPPAPVPLPSADLTSARANSEAFLRSLHLQVALSPAPPPERPDLLLVLVAGLRTTNPSLALPAPPLLSEA